MIAVTGGSSEVLSLLLILGLFTQVSGCWWIKASVLSKVVLQFSAFVTSLWLVNHKSDPQDEKTPGCRGGSRRGRLLHGRQRRRSSSLLLRHSDGWEVQSRHHQWWSRWDPVSRNVSRFGFFLMHWWSEFCMLRVRKCFCSVRYSLRKTRTLVQRQFWSPGGDCSIWTCTGRWSHAELWVFTLIHSLL